MIAQRLRTALACLVVPVALSGCADDGSGATALAPAPVAPGATASPAAVATAAPVAVPPSAQAEPPQGAAAFARFFYSEVERAYEQRDPEVIARLSAPGCKACGFFIDSIMASRDKDERIEGATYEIVFAEAPAIRDGKVAVSVVYNGPEAVRYAADGSVVSREPAASNDQQEVELVRVARSWLVQEVRAL